jgi:hydroxypyruvate reductase
VDDPRLFLRRLFDTAVAAASDFSGIAEAIPEVAGRVHVIGAGKAAAAMASAVERGLSDRRFSAPLSGFVVVPDGHGLTLAHLDLLFAAHPTPDERSEAAGGRALAEATSLGRDDLLVALISGGGSSLMAAPAPGVTLADKVATTRMLLNAGQPIATMNAVRGRLSAIKGGGLARAAWPARVMTFVVSDVPGDDPALVASGPTLGSRSIVAALPRDLERRLAPHVLARLSERQDVAAPADMPFRIMATADMALKAAAAVAEASGVRVLNLGGALDGGAGQLARDHAERVRLLSDTGPVLILSGGETTVRVTGLGRGGRNTEYLLALALALDRHPEVYAIAADTDGWDGVGPAAGAFCDPTTLARARSAGLSATASLADNDSLTLFERLGDAIVTGPTRTNVNDFRAILVR